MKVCSTPVPFAEPDYANYDMRREQEREIEHAAQIREKLKEMGYTGPNTGRILLEPMADGYAQYMLADAGRTFCLIHLPYGDAWDNQNVRFLPKREVIKRSRPFEEVMKAFA